VQNEAPHYAVFFILLLLPSSWVQILSSALSSQTHSIYLPPSMRETKSDTQKKVVNLI